MADFFDTRPAAIRPIGPEATLKIWAKGAPARTITPMIEKVPGTRSVQHLLLCKQGGELVATGRGQTPVGSARDACAQLSL